ncbi:MAG: class II D-tagatose-bisphosphate aldolase, non-catalytic subunit [Desulfobacterales bacterium]|nr:class II D-tagatose-bisphosphate aldolase, non-catalytic subunit [Desulfobacterales bacterium]
MGWSVPAYSEITDIDAMHPLYDMLHIQNSAVISVCSANFYVIEACIQSAYEHDRFLLVETTCNQVNPDGGYTGMTPMMFHDKIFSLCDEYGLPRHRIILGGDHLGPYPWASLSAENAMAKARELICEYVQAGFSKIHIDTSMALNGDPLPFPSIQQISERTAWLCKAAEQTYQDLKTNEYAPVYVIGSEVPVPGGSEKNHTKHVTDSTTLIQTLNTMKESFYQYGLESAWNRVIGLVIEAGIGFKNHEIIDYSSSRIKHLFPLIGATYPNIVFEGHSTDYQLDHSIQQMIADGFRILKIGPHLTFAFREALMGLWHIENLLVAPHKRSHLFTVVQETIHDHFQYCYAYYKEDSETDWIYSFYDRIRYYWNDPKIQHALSILIDNLTHTPTPLNLLSQYLPFQYQKIRQGLIDNHPKAIISDNIRRIYETYICCEL